MTVLGNLSTPNYDCSTVDPALFVFTACNFFFFVVNQPTERQNLFVDTCSLGSWASSWSQWGLCWLCACTYQPCPRHVRRYVWKQSFSNHLICLSLLCVQVPPLSVGNCTPWFSSTKAFAISAYIKSQCYRRSPIAWTEWCRGAMITF